MISPGVSLRFLSPSHPIFDHVIDEPSAMSVTVVDVVTMSANAFSGAVSTSVKSLDRVMVTPSTVAVNECEISKSAINPF